AGTSWILSSLNDEAALADVPVSLEFGTDGTAFGTDGCNRFNTSYTQDGANLTIDASGAMSMMACEEEIMNQAAAYMTALTSATTFVATPMQLTLLDDTSSTTLATFVAGTLEEAAAPADETEAGVEPATLPEMAEGDLAGTNWVLSVLDGALPIAGSTSTLQFGTDGSLTGTDGCNRFMTTFTQDGTNLTIEQPAGTMMACPEPVMEQADAFITALVSADNFVMADRLLVLRAGEQNLAAFVEDTQDLTDTAWEVVSYNNGREAVVGLIVGTQISANFGAEGDLSGNAGCNEYFTSFTAEDNAISISEPGATRRFCDEPAGIMTQEAEFLAALTTAATYTVEGNVLQMRTAEDALAVIMVRKHILDLPEPEADAPRGRVVSPQGLNIRSGPGTNFPIIGFAQNGDEGEIVGRSADNRWWAAAVPSAPNGIGWASADFVVATNVENVPVIASPPPPVVVPTLAPTPTPPPAPTATPSPEISFGADRTSIQAGECTTLRWSVNNVRGVWVYPQGERFEQFPRTGQGSEQVCPTNTTTYEMRVALPDGTIIFRQVTI
ncbi:MAG: META domain-containing protein, partial [Anaerolineales bacterium]|nr:META domain-containing protein [Anaerolineales bacterium]